MSHRGVLAAALVAVASCHPPPPRPPPQHHPLVLGPLRSGQPNSHELAFTPGKTYSGLEITYLLLAKDGAVVHQGTLEAGPIFDRKSLAAGRPTWRRIRRPEDQIKVVGGPRPLSPLERPTLDLEQVTSARLVRLASCRVEEVEWEPGDPLPPGVNEMPDRRTTFLRNICNRRRALRDPSIESTFRFRRVPDPAKAWIDVVGTFHDEFPAGVSFVVELLDAQHQQTKPPCALHVRHPEAMRNQEMSYHLEFDGEDAVARFRRVRSLRVRDVIPHGGNVREVTSQLICGPR